MQASHTDGSRAMQRNEVCQVKGHLEHELAVGRMYVVCPHNPRAGRDADVELGQPLLQILHQLFHLITHAKTERFFLHDPLH